MRSLALVAACLLCAACSDGDVLRTRFPDGKPWSEVHFSGGQPNGRCTTWHPNGTKAREGEYVDGHKHGLWSVWNPDGQLVVEIVYSRGRQQGQSRGWYADGKPKYVGHFRDGLLTGSWVEYFDNGRMSLQGTYENGVREGVWSGWDRDGKPIGAARYKKGHFVEKVPVEGEAARSANDARDGAPDNDG